MQEMIRIFQWFTVGALVIELGIVISNMRNRIHALLCLNCFAMLVSSLGYLMTLYCTTEEAFFMCTVISWFGKILATFTVLFLCAYVCGYKIPKILVLAERVFSVAVFLIISSTKRTGLFYSYFRTVTDGDMLIPDYGRGPFYIIWDAAVLCVVIASLSMLIKTVMSEKEFRKRKQYKTIITALVIEIVIGLLTMLPAGRYYDFNEVGFILIALLMILAILRYDFMDTESAAKDFIVDELASGVIALNMNDEVDYYNRIAENVFPEIRSDPKSVLEKIAVSIQNSEPVTIGGRSYTFEEKKLYRDAHDSSRMYVITDSTGYFLHLKELEDASYVDPLTGLMNRRSYDDALEGEHDAGSKCAVFCDLNSLKTINDNRGHAEGDRYIIEFAALLRESFPDGDIFRISGDEFVVLLYGMGKDEADIRMEGFRKSVNAHGRMAAFGYARGDADMYSLLHEAEEIMYADKNRYYVETGKDRRK